MNWNKLLPWRSNEEQDTEDSTAETFVVKGEGDGRVIVNESVNGTVDEETETEFGVTD